jgi:spore maturation protein CgeB
MKQGPTPAYLVAAHRRAGSFHHVSWGNGHATTYRSLLRELAARGHDVLFLERDVPWYACNRDAADDIPVQVALYGGLEELRDRFAMW